MGRGNSMARMKPIEFIAELNAESILIIPREAAEVLPKSGRVRVMVFAEDDSENDDWHNAAYEQFLRNDAPEDSVYDSLR